MASAGVAMAKAKAAIAINLIIVFLQCVGRTAGNVLAASRGMGQSLTQRPPTVCIPTAHLAALRRAAVRMQVPLTM